jgi:two-component system nitrogen regulation sensor histidine kinase NtrY
VRESIRRQVQVPLDDDMATLFVTLTVMHDEAGDALGTVVVFDDYTQLVKVQRMAAWREVARRIAHEIKNPLTPIQLSAQRLRRRFAEQFAGNPGGREGVRRMRRRDHEPGRHAQGARRRVPELRAPAHRAAAPDDLNRIVSEAMASYAGTDDVEFETDLDPALPTVDLDREQMRRALTQPDRQRRRGGQAPARAGRRRAARPRHAAQRHDPLLQSVRIEVADDGIGIPQQDRRRVFEPYFSTKDRGTGLGLAIVSRIVADHHGYIRVQANEPRGARFVVELPVSRLDADRNAVSGADVTSGSAR